MWCIGRLHHYLYGKRFYLKVDHEPLKFIFSPKAKLSPRLARWQLKLQSYDFNIIHIKGSCNIADFLSRMNCDKTETDEDTEIYLNFITDVSTPKQMTLHEINQETQKDSVLKTLARAIKENDWNNDIVKSYSAMKHEFCEHNNIILRENRTSEYFAEKAIKIIHEGRNTKIQKVKELLSSK